jgi:DNA-binding XRE family transcriptional regulator
MISGAQVRMARAGLGLTTGDLARAAGVSPDTIARIEMDIGANASTLEAVRRALEGAGAIFPAADASSACVRVPRGSAALAEPAMLKPEELNSSNDG